MLQENYKEIDVDESVTEKDAGNIKHRDKVTSTKSMRDEKAGISTTDPIERRPPPQPPSVRGKPMKRTAGKRRSVTDLPSKPVTKRGWLTL